MSTITDEGRKIALEKHGVRLLPTADDKSHLIVVSASWGPFVEGDYVTISLSAESYIAAGLSSVVATTDDILLPVGVHDFVISEGITHVALISTWSGAVATIWGS
jgi:hypothetical protein